MIIIHPRLTKFSSFYTKGSLSYRAKSAEKINEKIFGNTVKLYYGKKKNVDAGIIEDCYNFCLPENKGIEFSPLYVKPDDDYAGSTEILEKMGKYVGFMIDLPMTKSDKINIKTIPALMHESTHVLDYLLNPKYLANDRDFRNLAPELTDLVEVYKNKNQECENFKNIVDLYNTVFYKVQNPNENKAKILKEADIMLRNALKSVAPKEKIILLKYMRNSMILEQHAYKQDMHYARILKKLGKPVDDEDLTDYGKLIMFPEKIKIIEKLLAKTIKAERDKLRPQGALNRFIHRINKLFLSKSNANV